MAPPSALLVPRVRAISSIPESARRQERISFMIQTMTQSNNRSEKGRQRRRPFRALASSPTRPILSSQNGAVLEPSYS